MTPVLLARRRAHLRAFWIVMTTLVVFITAAAALAMQLRWPVLWGLCVGALSMAPGLIWSPWFGLGVRIWNRSVRDLQGRLRVLAVRIAFSTVFPLIGGGGGKVRLVPPPEGAAEGWSMWRLREAGDASFFSSSRDEGDRGWQNALLDHARRTGNWSVLGLVPLLFALRFMGEGREDASPPTSTYTLY